MPGELVGDAFVRITADTTFMHRAIRRAAKQDARAYTSDFGREMEHIADDKLARARHALAEALVEGDFEPFRRKLGDVRTSVDEVTKSLDQLRRQGDLNKREYDVAITSLHKWAKEAYAVEAATKAQADATKFATDTTRKFREEKVKTTEVIDEETKTIHRNDVSWRRWGLRIERIGNRLNILGDRVAILGDHVGRAFGKGSRADPVNAFGRSIEGLFYPIRALTEGFARLGERTGSFVKNLADATSETGGFKSALTGLTKGGLINFIIKVVEVAAVLVAIGSALPAVAAALSLLAGAITAIVGVVVTGLIGGLLALSPVILALVGGIGTLVLGFIAANKDADHLQKKLKKVTDLFQKEIKKLRKPFGRLIDDFVDLVDNHLSTIFIPFARGFVDATREIIKQLGRITSSKEFRAFVRVWQKMLPDIYEKFGRGLNNLLVGLLEFFTPILGKAEDLAEGFRKLTYRFRIWAGSPEGQNKIAQYMDTAWTAANNLWDILGNLLGILGKIFTSGSEKGAPGDDFLTYINKITDKFNKWLGTEEGQKAMKQFWEDVGTFMRRARDVLAGIWKLFDTLDTEKSRKNLNDFITGLRAFLRFAEVVVYYIIFMNEIALKVWGAFTSAAKGIKTFVEGTVAILRGDEIPAEFRAMIERAYNKVKEGLGKIGEWVFKKLVSWPNDTITPAMGGIAEAIGSPFAAARGNVQGKIRSIASLVREKFEALPEIVRKAMAGVVSQMVHPFVVAYTSISGWVNSIVTKIREIGSAISGAKEAFSRYTGIPMAAGGILTAPTNILAGEAGAEAIIPLQRPLSLVDPSVRPLAAIAQGKVPMAGGGVVGAGKQVTVEAGAIVVQAPQSNPMLVAEMTLDRLAHKANF